MKGYYIVNHLAARTLVHLLTVCTTIALSILVSNSSAQAQPENPCWRPFQLKGVVSDARTKTPIVGATAVLEVYGQGGFTLQLTANGAGDLVAADGRDWIEIPAFHSFELKPFHSDVPDWAWTPRSFSGATGSCPNGVRRQVVFWAFEEQLSPPGMWEPRYNQTLYTDPPEFSWWPVEYRSELIKKYEMVVQRAEDGEQVYQALVEWDGERSELISHRPADALGEGEFIWMTRSHTGYSSSPWSSPRPFEIKLPPEELDPPTMISPGGTVYTHEIEFSWTSVLEADQYEIEIYRSSFPGGTPYYQTTTWRTRLTPQVGFGAGHYCVRARAFIPLPEGNLYSEWSGCRQWEKVIPTPPGGLSPQGDMTTPAPLFSWQPSRGASSYDIYVANNETGAIVFDRKGLTGTSLQSPVTFDEGVEHCFAVKAYNEYYSSIFSPCVLFTYREPTPDKPEIVAPRGAFKNGLRPEFIWTAPEHATHYDIVVELVADGTQVFARTDLTETSLRSPLNLSPDQYCSRVEAVRKHNGIEKRSGYSDCVPFSIFLPLNDLTFKKPLDMAVVDSKPVFEWRGLNSFEINSFDLYILDEHGGLLRSASGLTTRSFTFEDPFVDGVYTALVKADLGAGIFYSSPSISFAVFNSGAEWRGESIGLDTGYEHATVTALLQGLEGERSIASPPVDIEVHYWEIDIQVENPTIHTAILPVVTTGGLHPVLLDDEVIRPGKDYAFQSNLIFPGGFRRRGVQYATFTMPRVGDVLPLTSQLLFQDQGSVTVSINLAEPEGNSNSKSYYHHTFLIDRSTGQPELIRNFWAEEGGSHIIDLRNLTTGSYSLLTIRNSHLYTLDPLVNYADFDEATRIDVTVFNPQDPDPTPSPTPSNDPDPTPSNDPDPTPTPSVDPDPTPSNDPDPSPTPTMDPDPTPSNDPDPTPTPPVDPDPTPQPTITPKPPVEPRPCPPGESWAPVTGCEPDPPQNPCPTGWLWMPGSDCQEDPPQPPCPEGYSWAPTTGGTNCKPLEHPQRPCTEDMLWAPEPPESCFGGALPDAEPESPEVVFLLMLELTTGDPDLNKALPGGVVAARTAMHDRLTLLTTHFEELSELTTKTMRTFSKKDPGFKVWKRLDRKVGKLPKLLKKQLKSIDRATKTTILSKIWKRVLRKIKKLKKGAAKSIEKAGLNNPSQ